MLKPLFILIVFISTISLVQCNATRSSPKSSFKPEFEGVITYHEIRKSNDGFIDIDDTVQHFYSHGNFVNIHSVKSSPFHIVKDYYLADKALRLNLFNNTDTLYQLRLNSPAAKLESFKVAKVNDRILSRDCENIQMEESFPEKDSTTYTITNYTFSRNYIKVDTNHFKGWKLGFFNKIVDESEAYYLRLQSVHYGSSHKNVLSTLIYDVISVKEMPIDPKVFEIDTTLVKWAK